MKYIIYKLKILNKCSYLVFNYSMLIADRNKQIHFKNHARSVEIKVQKSSMTYYIQF